MKFVILIFVIGILLRMVVKYILPVFRITSMASDQMRKMQDQMKEMDRKMNEQNKQTAKGRKQGDYIDYEELPQTPKGA